MADKQIDEFASLETLNDDDLLLVSSDHETYNVRVAVLKSVLNSVLSSRSGYTVVTSEDATDAVFNENMTAGVFYRTYHQGYNYLFFTILDGSAQYRLSRFGIEIRTYNSGNSTWSPWSNITAIAPGSIAIEKLTTSLQNLINNASTTASNALSAAQGAQGAANTANTAATAAQSTADTALAKATQALTELGGKVTYIEVNSEDATDAVFNENTSKKTAYRTYHNGSYYLFFVTTPGSAQYRLSKHGIEYRTYDNSTWSSWNRIGDIAGGSVTFDKLATAVQNRITALESGLSEVRTTANTALSNANTAVSTANSAAADATAAQTAATAAQSASTNAQNAATAAQTAATASQSASTAAQAAAQSAQTTANSAAANATEAKATAESADTKATQAKTAAQAAQTAATAAQTAAENAEDRVEALEDEFDDISINKDDLGLTQDEEGYVYPTYKGEASVTGIKLAAAGSGGGSGTAATTRITFSLTSPRTFAIADTATEANISFNFASVSIETGDSTGAGTLEIYVKGVLKKTMSVNQGSTTVNVAPYLTAGENKVSLKVIDGDDATATRTCTIHKETLTLTWNLESTMINSGDLTIQLLPNGTEDRTVTVKVDGVVYGEPDVITSPPGRRFTKVITGLSTGGHLIEAFATMSIGGATITSDTLACAVVQNTGISAVCPNTAEQYTSLVIPFRVVSATNPASITLKVNNNVVETRSSVDQSEQRWTYRPTATGIITMEITDGTNTWTKNVTVNGNINVEETSSNLAVKIDPSAITDLATYTNNGYSISLSENFDHINGGLQLDSDGVKIIRVTAGDRLTINYPLFSGDVTGTGREFKIIYKVQDSSNKNAEVISCMNGGIGFKAKANNAYLYGNQTTLSLSLCEDEKTELDVNIENRSGDRLMSMYESCSTFSHDQYASNESFTQNVAPGITFGSDDADVIIYLFRAYSRDLTIDEIKSNYIFDGSTGTEIINRQARNAIYRSEKISVSEATRLNPNVHFIVVNASQMPIGKEDTDAVAGTVQHYYGAGGAYHQWEADMLYKLQGTSSIEHAPFAGGNLDFDLSNITLLDGGTITVTVNGEETTTSQLTDGYAMNGVENSIPTKKLTFKKNVSAQDQIINKMCAEWYNRFQSSLRAARQNDARVRDCMESVMCCVLITNTGDTALSVGPDTGTQAIQPGETVFYGLGNLCSNKDAAEVFEYDDIVIEVKNNTEPQALFKSNDFSGTGFSDNYKFRYLNKNLYSKAEAEALFKEEVQDFIFETDWTAATDNALPELTNVGGIAYDTDSAAYRKARWIAEAPNHFDMDSLYWHHNVTLFFLLRDNRTKNMFWSKSKTTGKWGLWFNWDNDTGLCKNNEGYLDIEPGYMDFDTIGTSYVFNGATNALFTSLRENNADQLRANYLDRETAGAWNLDTLLSYYDSNQSAVCESLWIEDAQHNAIRILQNLNNSEYLARATGKLRLHIKKALMFQKALIDSYYNSSAGVNDSASFRGYTPSQWAGVEPNGLLTIVPYTDMWINMLAGSTPYRQRAYAGQPVQIDISASLNDTEIYLRNAQWIQEIGDMSGMYLGSFNASKLKRVKTLLIGSNAAGYYNTNFTNASFDNCKKLSTLNMGGLQNATRSFNFSANIYLKNLYTKGSGITGIVIANGGKLETARLNAVSVLELRNLKHLSTLEISSYDNLANLVVNNCPLVDVATLCTNAVNLAFISIKDVALQLPNSTLLMKLAGLKGINDSGVADSSYPPVLTGTADLTGMSNYCKDIIESTFPSLELTIRAVLGAYTVRFMLDASTQYGNSQTVEEGCPAVKPATDPASSITASTISEFVGWQGSYNNITQDTDILASWIDRTRYYNLTWLDKNGNTLQSQRVGYGSAVAYSGNDLPAVSGYLWTGFDWKSWAYAAANLIDDSTESIIISATYDEITLPPIRDMANYDYIYSDDYNDSSAYTLGELAAIAERHLGADYGFEIGDRVKIVFNEDKTIPDTYVICQLERFNDRRLANGGEKDTPHTGGDFSAFANMSFGMIGTLANARGLHSANTNVGGYAMTTTAAWLDDTVFPCLPPGWRSLIKLVQVHSSAGNSSSEMTTSNRKLRLYTAAEVGIYTSEPYASELDAAREDDGSVVMPFYRSNSRVKKTLNGTGTAQGYWTLSPYFGSSTNFCIVYTTGYATNDTATGAYSIAFSFSI